MIPVREELEAKLKLARHEYDRDYKAAQERWRLWERMESSVKMAQAYFKDGPSIARLTEQAPALAMFALAANEAAAEIVRAKEVFRQAVQEAQTAYEQKVARANKEHVGARSKVRGSRRKAKQARNLVFKRFLESGNEKEAIAELQAMSNVLGHENR